MKKKPFKHEEIMELRRIMKGKGMSNKDIDKEIQMLVTIQNTLPKKEKKKPDFQEEFKKLQGGKSKDGYK